MNKIEEMAKEIARIVGRELFIFKLKDVGLQDHSGKAPTFFEEEYAKIYWKKHILDAIAINRIVILKGTSIDEINFNPKGCSKC